MSMSDPIKGVTEMFQQHPFLCNVDQRLSALLAAGAEPFHFKKGEYLARAGEPTKSFYMVQTGRAMLKQRREDGAAIDIQTVLPGEVIGWSWIVPPHRWQFDAEALDDMTGIRFNAEWLRQKCEDNHDLGYCVLKHLLGVLANRLSATRRNLASPIGTPPNPSA